MKSRLMLLRAALSVLLVGSAILFLIGSTIERNNRHHEPTASAQSGHTEGSGREGAAEEPSGGHTESGEGQSEGGHPEAGAKMLGVDTESLELSIAAFVLSVLLASAVWLRRWSRLILLAVIGFGFLFAAGDAREVVRQLDESDNGLAAVAAILIALHLGVAALAGLLLVPRSSPGLRATEAT